MPVLISEFIKIKSLDGKEYEGKGIASNLVAIESEDGSSWIYGQLLGMTKVRSKIICDSGPHCCKSTVDEEFHTSPKIIEFDDEGQGPGSFIKDVAEVVIASDYKGQKVVFCCYECAADYFKRAKKALQDALLPAGKGARTFNPVPPVELDSAAPESIPETGETNEPSNES